jgi:microcystin-dependent protein
MSDPYLGDVRAMSFDFVPHGWAPCQGQLVPVAQNQALFSVLGTTYGGDGIVNFGLPKLAGVPAQNGAELPYCICMEGLMPLRQASTAKE